MDMHRTGDLQIDQDPDAQRHHWIAERVGWTVITLVILAGCSGPDDSARPASSAMNPN